MLLLLVHMKLSRAHVKVITRAREIITCTCEKFSESFFVTMSLLLLRNYLTSKKKIFHNVSYNIAHCSLGSIHCEYMHALVEPFIFVTDPDILTAKYIHSLLSIRRAYIFISLYAASFQAIV